MPLVSDSLDGMNCTRIAIAHRLSTTQQCNRIIVQDQGRIAEDGTYEELMAMNGHFPELAKRQTVEENIQMEICRLSTFETWFAFMKYHTALSRRYAAQAEACGAIYGAKRDGAYAGFLCTARESGQTRITWAFTIPEYRRQGVFTGLVRHVMEQDPGNIRIAIASDSPCRDEVRKIILEVGFVPTEKVTVFSCSREDENRWRAFMEQKGKRLCETLEAHGYRAVPFQDLDAKLLEQLRASDRSEYGNSFHPAMYLDYPANRLSWDLSFAAVRDGKLAAYCLVTMGDPRSAMFDQISVSADEQGRGVILLPYVASMNRFFERELSVAYYAMYGSNEHANAFRNRVLNIFRTQESTTENYHYFSKG